MSARAGLISRARAPQQKLAKLPDARDLLPPELLAGSAGAPIEWVRRFHGFFFDVADLCVEADGLLVLHDVVIGRPSPLLREIQLWAAMLDRYELLRMSANEVAIGCGLTPKVRHAICTEMMLYIAAVKSSPDIDDVDLRHSITSSLLVNTTDLFARLAPYVCIGGGVVRACRRA